jgi:lysophospholipase L1-like esterase
MIKELIRTITAIIVVFAVIEVLLRIAYFVRNSAIDVVPLPYVIGHDYGPIPPWGEDLRILEPDDALIWRNRSNEHRQYIDVFSPCHRQEDRTALLRQFIPTIPASLEGNPVWELFLNSDGFRNREISREKPSSVFRIICLGDSWTFGVNVDQDQAYPQQLEALLRREYPDRRFEVVNLGVMGYSSFQGLELLKRYAIFLDPDLLISGFGMNDASVAGYRDRDMPGTGQEKTTGERATSIIERIEIYKLLQYIAQLMKYNPPDLGQELKAVAEKPRGAESAEEYEELEEWTRVSLSDYESNMSQLLDLAGDNGTSVYFLFNEIWGGSPYRDLLERISVESGSPFIDSSSLIAQARESIEEELERRLDLVQPEEQTGLITGDIEVVFRVYAANHPVPEAIYIVGDHPKLGSLRPNEVRMYDDGTHGDQRSGDDVWSYTATFNRGTKVPYVYTNSGTRGEWEGLDIPDVRKFAIETDDERARIYMSIDTFGELYMQADSWHTNAMGYGLIAEAILEALNKDRNFNRQISKR